MMPLLIPIIKIAGEYVLTESGLIYDEEEAIENIHEGVNRIESALVRQTSMLSGIQSSIGAIGMMSAVGCVLSAVNVFQLIKVQKKLSAIERKIDDGFIDLENYFEDKLNDLLDHLQKQRLSQAYNYYSKGVEELKTSLLIKDPDNRKLSLNNCLSLLYQSVSLYDDKQEYQNINTPAKLRRLECCWMIEASIAECRCIQGEYAAALNSYKNLFNRIRNDSKSISLCLTDDNYLFILSDLDWIYNNDMKILETKIQLLEEFCNQKKTSVYKIKESYYENQDDIFNSISFPTAVLYLDCLINPVKSKELKNEVIKNSLLLKNIKYRYINFENLPLIHLCDLFLKLSKSNEPKHDKNLNADQKNNKSNVISKAQTRKEVNGCLLTFVNALLILFFSYIFLIILFSSV